VKKKLEIEFMANSKKPKKKRRTRLDPVFKALKKPFKLPFKLKKWF
jgi:hypothetical protein